THERALNLTRLIIIFSGLILTISTSGPVFAQKKAAGGKVIAQERSLYGVAKGRVYTNRVLGMKLTVPQFMPIAEQSFIDIALVSTAPAAPDKIFAGRRLLVKLLFNAEGYSPKSERLMRITCTAMKLPPSHSNASGADVLNEQSASSGGPSTRHDTLGVNKIAYIDQKTRFAANRSYSFVRKAHHVSCVMMYWTDDDLETMRSVLAEADLNWNGK
ncbi:MAG TPA: hypothetical protein VNA17_02665, partial [Pyrinomonadaceae bacterium]|nr:hypothetical protein [Pyrinomonadaceae bacterium]